MSEEIIANSAFSQPKRDKPASQSEILEEMNRQLRPIAPMNEMEWRREVLQLLNAILALQSAHGESLATFMADAVQRRQNDSHAQQGLSLQMDAINNDLVVWRDRLAERLDKGIDGLEVLFDWLDERNQQRKVELDNLFDVTHQKMGQLMEGFEVLLRRFDKLEQQMLIERIAAASKIRMRPVRKGKVTHRKAKR